MLYLQNNNNLCVKRRRFDNHIALIKCADKRANRNLSVSLFEKRIELSAQCFYVFYLGVNYPQDERDEEIKETQQTERPANRRHDPATRLKENMILLKLTAWCEDLFTRNVCIGVNVKV